MSRAYFASLRFRLLFLVLLSVIPALGLMLLTAASQRQLAAEAARADALRLTRLAASNLERSIEGARQVSGMLAGLREVRDRDAAACGDRLAVLLKQSRDYANLGAVTPDGKMFCSAIRSEAPVDASDSAWFQRTLRARDFAVGEHQIGPVSRKPVLVAGYPALDAEGAPLAVTFAALDLEWLNGLAAEAQLPEGAALVVIDRQATILGRHPDPAQWIGRTLPEAPLIETILGQGEGTTESPGVDGITRLFAFTPVRGTAKGVFVSIGISTDAAFAGANRVFARSLLGLALVGALALLAAWRVGDLVILRRVDALVRAAKRLTEGDLGARAEIRSRDEIGVLAQTFNGMAERLAAMVRTEQQAREAVSLRSREVELLGEMGQLIQACPNLEEAYPVIGQFIQQLFPDDAGAVFVISPSRHLVEVGAEWGAFPTGERSAFAIEECWAIRRGGAHLVEDTGSGLLCRHLPTPLPTAYLCVPLVAHGEALGVLYIGRPPGPDGEAAGWTEAVRTLAMAVAERLALALANLRLVDTLRGQAIRDPLTGLFNRRYMEETLERELRWAERRERPLAVIVLDIDHFKPFNDRFGHEAGDGLLRELAILLKTNSRAGDIACRYGGEEFVLILPDASLDNARRRAAQIMEAARNLRVFHRDQALDPITLSLGVAAFPEHGRSGEALLRTADAALYQAKAAGRDRVIVAH